MDVNALKRAYDRDRLLALAEREGLRIKAKRMQCPHGCHDDPTGCAVSDKPAGAVWHCKRCDSGGSVVDLVTARRRCDVNEALAFLAELNGVLPAAKPRKPDAPPPDASGLWEGLAQSDAAGTEYLRSRGLVDAVDLGLVRFNVGGNCKHTNGSPHVRRECGACWLDTKARDGYRIAVPLRDHEGLVRNFQVRAINASADPKVLSLPRLTTKAAAVGDPFAAFNGSLVFCAEGLADTLAVQLCGGTVVGGTGTSAVPFLSDLLGNIKGRRFVLCPQNDKERPPRSDGKPQPITSQQAFAKLASVIVAAGGVLRWLRTPSQWKDVADWHRDAPDVVREAVTNGGVAHEPEEIILAAEPIGTLESLSKSYASLCQILRNSENRALVTDGKPLEWNLMLADATIGRRQVNDHDFSRIREVIEHRFSKRDGEPLRFGINDIALAVRQIAHEAPFHPVEEYLCSLRWDGQSRIASLGVRVLGCEDTAITRLMLRRWLISAVARVLPPSESARRDGGPGCKVDTMLILQGDQGYFKSTFFSVLAGERDWFADENVDLYNKDSLLVVERKWIWEWPELEPLRRARDASVAKAFLSKSSDDFRRPYGRTIENVPRRVVIVGTTNEEDILMDPTGARRYWILGVRERVDIAVLRAERDQIWAEAIAAYRSGERWWIDHEDDEEARTGLTSLHRRFEHHDVWEESILGYVRDANLKREDITVEGILDVCLKKKEAEWTKGDQMRVAAVLRQAGLRRVRRMEDGVRSYNWVAKDAQTTAE